MRILEFSGGVMAFNESGTSSTSFRPDFSSVGSIPAEAVKEEGEGLLHVDCKNDDIKSKMGKINMVVKNKCIKGAGDIRVRRLDRPMHYQVLKIQEEDSHLGEDIGTEGLTSKDKLAFVHHATAHILWPRSVLPSSRLGSNKTINQIKAG